MSRGECGWVVVPRATVCGICSEAAVTVVRARPAVVALSVVRIPARVAVSVQRRARAAVCGVCSEATVTVARAPPTVVAISVVSIPARVAVREAAPVELHGRALSGHQK